MRTSLSWIATIALGAACGDSGANMNATETSSTGSSSSSSTTSPTTTSPTTGAPACTPGEIVCTSATEQAECGADGQPGAPTTCPDGGACVDGTGCVACTAGEVRCEGEELQQCSDAGEWEVLQTCNAAQGLACDAGALACTGECLPESLPRTASGCEFYAVTTVQLGQMGGIFAVVLENANASDATVTITQNEDFTPIVEVVPAGEIAIVELPFVAKLWDAFKGELVRDGAYRIQSDRPIQAYQYSTLNVTASVDSSLLWPRHTWGTSYFVASYDATEVQGGFYRGSWAVIGGEEELSVTVTPRPGTKAKGGPGIGVDGGGKAPLDTGDVLQILSADDGDLTGAMFVADKPVLVFGGHECSFMPAGVGFCDHIEEAMLPVSQLGTEYVVVAPSRHNPPTERRAQVVRIIATEANTTLTYDPPLMDAPAMIAGAGEFVELTPTAENFTLVTDKPVLVAQYMPGATFDGEDTDPAMLVTLPVARWHTSHHVHALPDWLPVDVDIMAPTGAVVTVDGMPVANFVDVGNSPYRVAHVRFDSDPGLVEIAGDQPIAVNVYATTSSMPTTSFWHSTGGLFADEP